MAEDRLHEMQATCSLPRRLRPSRFGVCSAQDSGANRARDAGYLGLDAFSSAMW